MGAYQEIRAKPYVPVHKKSADLLVVRKTVDPTYGCEHRSDLYMYYFLCGIHGSCTIYFFTQSHRIKATAAINKIHMVNTSQRSRIGVPIIFDNAKLIKNSNGIARKILIPVANSLRFCSRAYRI